MQREVPISVLGITPDDHTLIGFGDLCKTSVFMLTSMWLTYLPYFSFDVGA